MTGRPVVAETSTHGSVLAREVVVSGETFDSATVESGGSDTGDLSELEHPQKRKEIEAAIRMWRRGIGCRLRIRAL